MQFSVQFLDVSAAVIKEMHIDAHSVAGAIELVAGLDWPTGAVRIVAHFPEGPESPHCCRWGAVSRGTCVVAKVRVNRLGRLKFKPPLCGLINVPSPRGRLMPRARRLCSCRRRDVRAKRDAPDFR